MSHRARIHFEPVAGNANTVPMESTRQTGEKHVSSRYQLISSYRTRNEFAITTLPIANN
jgi:hypothetical protein